MAVIPRRRTARRPSLQNTIDKECLRHVQERLATILEYCIYPLATPALNVRAANFERRVAPLNAGNASFERSRSELKMKVLHIAAGLAFGGIAEVVGELSRNQVGAGCKVFVATVASETDELISSVNKAQANGVQVVRFAPSWPRQLFFSWAMVSGLKSLVQAVDVVHVHSNWTFPVWCGCHFALKYRKPLVMTPHGCLAPERLAHSRWKKRLVGVFDRYYLKRASVVHATCAAETNAIKNFIGSASSSSATAPLVQGSPDDALKHAQTNALPAVVVVPNGVDLDEFAGDIDASFWRKQYPQIGDKKVILALGRIHPLKGLDILLEAAAVLAQGARCSRSNASDAAGSNNSQAAELDANWLVVIAGPDEQGTLSQLKLQASQLKLEERVIFAEPIPPSERKNAIGSAHCLVLPSRHENFGLSVVEALACGVPVISTRGAPWAELLGKCASGEEVRECENARVRELRQGRSVNEGREVLHSGLQPLSGCENGACEGGGLASDNANALPRSGWWIDHGVEPLAEALGEAIALSDAERRTMGQNGRRLVEAKYQWSAVAQTMAAVYASIVTAE